jgi:uncharacterized protein (DUF488 family)
LSNKVIYTVGTSNRSIDEFIDILKAHKIKIAIDIRSFPTSKRFPYFNQESLTNVLEKEDFKYIYLGKELGGFRKCGYECYMETDQFKQGIEKIEEIAKKDLAVFFCAEKLYFHCHRRFIAEVLAQRGWRVFHIIEKERIYQHQLKIAYQNSLDF